MSAIQPLILGSWPDCEFAKLGLVRLRGGGTNVIGLEYYSGKKSVRLQLHGVDVRSRFLKPIKAMDDSTASFTNDYDCAAISGTRTLFNFHLL